MTEQGPITRHLNGNATTGQWAHQAIKRDAETQADTVPMVELLKTKNELEVLSRQMVATEEQFTWKLDKHKKEVSEIPVGSAVSIKALERDSIGIYELETGRQTGFVGLGRYFAGLRRQIVGASENRLSLVDDSSYVNLNIDTMIRDWNVVDVNPPETNG